MINPKSLLLLTVFSLGATQTVRSQSKPAADTSLVETSVVAVYDSLFGKQWSEKFAEEWNARAETAKALGKMGNVYFVSIARETTSVFMNFDSLGKGRVLGV